MIKIMFVCHGNICRSPMAEFYMKDLVNKKGENDLFQIASAATSTEEIWNGIGNPIYPPARKELLSHGIGSRDNELGVSEKRAHQFTLNDYKEFDYIVGMDQSNLRGMLCISNGDPDHKLSLLLDYTNKPRDVADPWYTGDFRATWNDVKEGCNGLYQYIKKDINQS